MQIALGRRGLSGTLKQPIERYNLNSVRIALQQPGNDLLILNLIQGAGGVNQRAAGFEGVEGTVEQIALGRCDLMRTCQRPVFQRISIFANHPFA